ncbi:hypothetical protein YC2023_027536 [Brassica napus]
MLLLLLRNLLTNSANTLVDHLNRKSCSPSAHQAHETLGESSIATPSEVAIATPFTKSHEVHSTSCSEIDVTIPTLAAASVALSYSPIMEVIPSQSIISEDPESFVNDQQIVHTAQPTHIPQQFYRESETPITYGKGSGFEKKMEQSVEILKLKISPAVTAEKKDTTMNYRMNRIMNIPYNLIT